MELTAAIPAAVGSVAGMSDGAALGAGNNSFHHDSGLQSCNSSLVGIDLPSKYFFQTLCNNRRRKYIEENLV